MAWLGTWANRIELKTDKSRVDSALTNFPIMLHISASSGVNGIDLSAVFDNLTADANRKKIAVTTSDETTQCYVEIKSWDDANEQAYLFVKLPSVAADDYTHFFLYYDVSQSDNTTYVGDPTDAVVHNVWESAFVSVMHLGENGTGAANEYNDSSTNAHHGTGGNPGTKLQDIQLIVENNGAVGTNYITSKAFEDDDTLAAKLHIEYTVGGAPQADIDVQVELGYHDTRYFATGNSFAYNTSIYYGHDGTLADMSGSLMFALGADLTGAVCTEAHLSLYCYKSGSPDIKIRADKQKVPVPPDGATPFLAITKTTASVTWQPVNADWAWVDSPDLVNIINELIGLASTTGRHPSQTTGIAGKAQLFNGSLSDTTNGVGNNQYIRIPDHNDFSATTTNKLWWGVWLKPTVLNWYDADGVAKSRDEGTLLSYINMLGKGAGMETPTAPQTEWVVTLGSKDSIYKPSELTFYMHALSAGSGYGAGVYPDPGYAVNDDLFQCSWANHTTETVYLKAFFPDGSVMSDEEGYENITYENGTAPVLIGGGWAVDQGQWYKGILSEFWVRNDNPSAAWMKAINYAMRDKLILEGSATGSTEIDKSIVASGDDGANYELTGFNSGNNDVYLGHETSLGTAEGYFRFTGFTGLGSKTIANAIATFYMYTAGGAVNLKIYAVDDDNAIAPTTAGEFAALSLTTACVDWDNNTGDYAWVDTPDLSSIIQELVDSYGDTLSSIVLVLKNDGTVGAKYHDIKTFDNTPSYPATLHFEYGAAELPGGSTEPATNLTPTTATLNGYLSDLGSAASVVVSFEYGLDTGYGQTAVADESPMSGLGGFHSDIENLTAGLTYHYRAKMVGDATIYGYDEIFVPRDPIISTTIVMSARRLPLITSSLF